MKDGDPGVPAIPNVTQARAYCEGIFTGDIQLDRSRWRLPTWEETESLFAQDPALLVAARRIWIESDNVCVVVPDIDPELQRKNYWDLQGAPCMAACVTEFVSEPAPP